MPIIAIDPSAVLWLLAVIVVPIVTVFAASAITLLATLPGIASDLARAVQAQEEPAAPQPEPDPGRSLWDLVPEVDPFDAPTLPFPALDEATGRSATVAFA